jgi:hypothetical protein
MELWSMFRIGELMESEPNCGDVVLNVASASFFNYLNVCDKG